MSATVDTPASSAPDRGATATRRLCEVLALGTLKPKDLKHLSVALAEASAQEVGHNVAFRGHVLAIYRELQESQPRPTATRVGNRARAQRSQPTPIRHIDSKLLGPDKPLDPYLLQYAYGDHQLRAVLEMFPVREVKNAVALVEQRNPGTKPANRAQKAALINYIVQQLAPSS